MTLYAADGSTLIDVHALPIEEKDLVILRSDRDLHMKDYEELQRTVLASNPTWRGGLMVLKTDESIEKLDVNALRNLYDLLKSMFESWDKYAAAWESDTAKCVRCGQDLPAQDTNEEDHAHDPTGSCCAVE